MMHSIVILGLAFLQMHSALKIAISEDIYNKIFSSIGTGSGSGSGSPSPSPSPSPPPPATTENSRTPADIVSRATGLAVGSPKTVTTPRGSVVTEAFDKTDFEGATAATTLTDQTGTGYTATIPAAAKKELANLVPAGKEPVFVHGPGLVGDAPTKPSKCTHMEFGFAHRDPITGVSTNVDVSITTPMCFTFPSGSCAADATTCATWDKNTKEWDSSCASGTPPTCCYTCLSRKGATGGSSSAKGDPKATNMAGQNFEILAMGTFQLLSITSLDQMNKLTLDAMIDRAGEMCGATYIKNISMTGSWIEKVDGVKQVRIRAASNVPKHEGLQIALDSDEWTASKHMKKINMIKTASAEKLVFRIYNVTIESKIDAHRVRKNGVKSSKFANFLDVDVKGLKDVKEQGVNLGGLLAYDDHSFATQAPDGCKPGKITNLKQKLAPFEFDGETKFLSSVAVE